MPMSEYLHPENMGSRAVIAWPASSSEVSHYKIKKQEIHARWDLGGWTPFVRETRRASILRLSDAGASLSLSLSLACVDERILFSLLWRGI